MDTRCIENSEVTQAAEKTQGVSDTTRREYTKDDAENKVKVEEMSKGQKFWYSADFALHEEV